MPDFHHCALSFPLPVKDDRHYIADFACGDIDAGHIWAEPKEDQTSALYLDANFEKTFKIDDVSSVFHYALIAETGGLNTCITGEGKGEIRCSEFDGMMHGDELTTLPLAVSISNSSKDNFLDVDFAKKVPDLDCKFCDELSGGNLMSAIHSPGTSNEEGVSDTSILEPLCFTDQCGKVTVDKIGDSDSTWTYEDEVKKGHKCSPKNDIHDFSKSSIVHNTLEIGYSFSNDKKTQFSLGSVGGPCTFMSTEDVDSVSQCIELDDFCVDDLPTDNRTTPKLISTRQKRLCRPPQRYLDSLPWFKSTMDMEKKQCNCWSKGKDLGVRSEKKQRRTGLRGRPPTGRTRNLEFDSDEDYEHHKSCVNERKSWQDDRRKNNKPWKLDEVVALVDGISKFGKGQWTAVKKSAFSNSSRTPTDIRDKWRNLVKTNCKSSKSRKGDQNMSLPQSLIEQVREIANAPESSSKRGRRLSNGR